MKTIFKQPLYFLLLTLLSLFIACSNDDDETAVGSSGDLVGTWTLSDSSFEFLVDGTDFLNWISTNLGLTGQEAETFQELFEEGFAGEFSGTITFNDDQSYSANLGGESEAGTWLLVGSTLTLTPSNTGDTPTVLNVVTLNASTAIVEFNESETDDLDLDGSDENISITVRLTFTK